MNIGSRAVLWMVAMAVAMASDVALCFAQSGSVTTVAFYNVENLFDVHNDPMTADEDMLPKADRAWSSERYVNKLSAIARVIADMDDDGKFPAVVGVAEVENGRVLEDLVAQKEIAAAGYSFCHYDSPDERGIDVALLYRPDLFEKEGSRAVRAEVADAEYLRTRDMLLVWGRLCGRRVMFCILHWPSRIGGVAKTRHLREGCARQLRSIIEQVVRESPDMGIIIMGDMNDNPHNRSLRRVVGARRSQGRIKSDRLYNITAASCRGTSVYDGRWNKYDNIIVSGNLLQISDNDIWRVTKPGRDCAVRLDYMLDKRGHPLATYRGSDYMGGISDHLPIKFEIGE